MSKQNNEVVGQVKIEGAAEAIAAIRDITTQVKKLMGEGGDNPPAPPSSPADL